MLPAGEYLVILKRHPKVKHRVPYINKSNSQDTPPMRGEMERGSRLERGPFLSGNGVHAKDFGSTIIVGKHLVPGVVVNSQHYFRQLVKRIEASLRRKHKITLIIR